MITTNIAVSKTLVRRAIRLSIAVLLAIGCLTPLIYWRFQSFQSRNLQPPLVKQPEIKTITALGRLEPEGEVIKLAAPTLAEGSRVEQLLVKEGDQIEVNQIIAILDNRDRLQAALEEAQEQIRVTQAELAQVLAGAKRGEIQAQRFEIARLEAERVGNLNAQTATVARLAAEVENAQTEYQRYESLYQNGAIAALERDRKLLAFTTTQKQLQEAQAALERITKATQEQVDAARATLAQIAEVRPVDVQIAEARVRQAIASAKQAEKNLDQAYIRTPQSGRILKIHARPGELISSEVGLAEVGQTQRMYAVAEIYQSDIHQVRVGQSVKLTSESLPNTELYGTVESIGLQVQRQEVINSDPSDNIDSRIIEVKVQLDALSSQKVANLTNLQVQTVIES